MSDSQTISCPQCNHKISLSESLSADISKKLQAKFEVENQKKEIEFQKEREEFQKQKKELNLEVAEKVQKEKQKMWIIAQEKAKEKQETELKDLKEQNEEGRKKLEESQKNELELRKKSREIEEKEKNLDLELQRKVDKERVQIIEQTKKDSAEDTRLKLAEKDKQIEQMTKSLDAAKRQSEQGSMQIQGEAKEDDLKNLLIRNFPLDQVSDVPQGVRGGDLVQTIYESFGDQKGIILWEAKNTKSFSSEWIKKLKGDQGLVKADLCILVTKTLPDDIDHFGEKDGVWIADYNFVLPLCSMLRMHLVELNQTKNSLVGRDQKMEYLYNYLSGPEFKNRIENIVMGFNSLKSDLETEKRSMQRIWSKREKELERVITSTSGMYGDLQGIVGASLATVESLELPGGDE